MASLDSSARTRDPHRPPTSLTLWPTRGYPNPSEPRSFLRDVVSWRTAATPRVLPRIAFFTLWALGISLFYSGVRWTPVAVSHVQYTGAVLVLLLVLRTNASYDRWWEARKLWGGIVNQSRNLAIRVAEYGPKEDRGALLRWVAAFPHACRRSLRGQREAPELVALLSDEARAVTESPHMPLHVAQTIASRLRSARDDGRLEGIELLATDRELSLLIDYVGACERILKTPLPLVHRLKLRRFIVLYLAAFPFIVVSDQVWLAPVITSLVAYPLLAIDHIGQELESPFSQHSLSHLPLDSICDTIQANVLALDRPGRARAEEE